MIGEKTQQMLDCEATAAALLLPFCRPHFLCHEMMSLKPHLNILPK